MKFILVFFICVFFFETTQSKDVVLNNRTDISKQIVSEGNNFIIKSIIDLKGKNVFIPANSILTFQNGRLQNGSIIGNNTKIFYKDTVFENVHILGSWNVPIIKSSMFQNVTSKDVLKDVVALANSNVANTVYIDSGTYVVSAPSCTKGALYIPSRTHLVINGSISLIPNDYLGCAVIYIKDAKNVTISGKGIIIGDKIRHTGTKGEWGMGIQIMNSKNIRIENQNIYNCWGDCIYVGGKSSNVSIINCNLHHARRQGISVTYAISCKIDRCKIHDIAGTEPEYGIDFEPNANCSVHHISVINTEIYNCKGGIIAGIKGGTAKNATVGDITISNCYVYNLRSKNTFRWHNCRNITISDCTIDKPMGECTFMVDARDVSYGKIKVQQ